MRARMDGDGPSTSLVGLCEGELEVEGASREKGQRSFECELFDAVESDVMGGDESELDECRAGQEDGAEDSMSAEPGMVSEGQARGEDERLGVGERDGGAEQGVVRGGETDRACVREAGLWSVEPESLTLKGIGREVDASGLKGLEEGVPVELVTVGVKLSEGEKETIEIALVATQRADNDGGYLRVLECLVESK